MDTNNPTTHGEESLSESLIKVDTEVYKTYTQKWDSNFPWKTEVCVIQGDSPRRIRDIIESAYDIDYYQIPQKASAWHHRFEVGDGNVELIVLPFVWVNSSMQVALLVHEIAHMVFSIFKSNDYVLPIDKENNDEEFFNDMLQYWTQVILDFLNSEDKESMIYLFNNEKLK